MQILRHNASDLIGTDLDPIEDILNLISSLKSREYTSDLLRQKHGLSNKSDIQCTSKLISLHIDNAIELSKQGLEGSPETSYLPLYYSLLNLTKVDLLFYGKRIELEKNRWHGAKYNEKEMSRIFLNERIEIKNNGTIPLYYKTISGTSIPNKGLKIKLEDIYSHISCIGAEYNTITKTKHKLFPHTNEIIQDDNAGHCIRIYNHSEPVIIPKARMLKAYPKIKLIRPIDNAPEYYESAKIKGDFIKVQEQFKANTKRYLLSDIYHKGSDEYWLSWTPINGKRHVFPEELSILLAFFHLSNVVRYNPEHLYKLRDSRYWVLMLALRKHGFLRFIKLMWGSYQKISFDLY